MEATYAQSSSTNAAIISAMAFGAGNSCVNSLTPSIVEMVTIPPTIIANRAPPGPTIANASPTGANMPPITALIVINWRLLDNCDTKRAAPYEDLPAQQLLSAKCSALKDRCEILANLLQQNGVCHLEDTCNFQRFCVRGPDGRWCEGRHLMEDSLGPLGMIYYGAA